MRRLRWLVYLTILIGGLANLQPQPVAAEGQTRLVLAFYYAWFDPNSFGAGKTPFTPPTPYYSSDVNVIQNHVNQARAAGIDGFVQSWYGPAPNQQTEPNFAALLNVAAGSGFSAAVDFETASPFFTSNQDRINALNTLLTTHVNHPAYLRVDGKPVIFFWANWLLSVDDWNNIRNAVDPNHTTTWIAEGANANYLAVFDGLHLYNTAWSDNPAGAAATWGATTRAASTTYGTFKYWVATAMPGWDDTRLNRPGAFVRDRANGAYYQASFVGAAASSPDMLIVSTFNEWPEGSNIEPSNEFGNYYLDLTAQLAAAYKTGNVAPPPPPPTVTPGPSPTPAPTKTPGPSPTPLPTATPLPPPTPVPSPTPDATGAVVYRVQSGDTLFWIAYRFGVTLDDLYRLNNLTPATGAILTIGQPVILGHALQPADSVSSNSEGLSISQAKTGTLPTPTPEGWLALFPPQFSQAQLRDDGAFIHVVQAGDTLVGIAVRYGLTLEEMYAASGLNAGSILQIGQVVTLGQLPQPEASGGSTDWPTPPATTTLVPTPTPTPRLTATAVTLPAPTASAESLALLPTPTLPVPVAAAAPIDQQSLLPVFMGLFGSLVVLGGLIWYISRTALRRGDW